MKAIGGPLEDGSIDPGDFEEVASHLLKFLTEQPTYKAIVRFTKEKRTRLAELYGQLGKASSDEFEEFIGLNQKVAVDIAVETMFTVLVQAGVIEDKR